MSVYSECMGESFVFSYKKTYHVSDPATLTERIFEDYSPLVRPDPNGDPINVGHQFELLSVNSLVSCMSFILYFL